MIDRRVIGSKSILIKEFKMRKSLFSAWLLVPVLAVSGQIPLKDKPLKGEWRFAPEKIWEIQKAGDDDFGRIAEILVSDASDVVVRDFKKNVSYLFDSNGRFLKKFAPQGKEDGQLSFYLNRFRAGDKIVLASPDKLHVFSSRGDFERAVDNNLFLRFPLHFVSEHEFIYAPNVPRSPVNEKKLFLFDTRSGQEKLLADFSGTDTPGENAPPGPMIMIFSLTPQVRLACDGRRMAFGRSDRYRIFLADPSGAILSSFGLDRKPMTASLEDKRRHLAGTGTPEQMEKIIAQLPDRMTFFSHLEFINGFLGVYAVNHTDRKTMSQQIDLFSEQGEFVYSGKMEFGEHREFGSPSNLVLKGEYAYVVLEDDQGRQTLAKYRIRLPR